MFGSDIADVLVDAMNKRGATSCVASVTCSKTASVGTRLCKFEKLEKSEDISIEAKAFVGNRMSVVSGKRIDKNGLLSLAEKAVELAKLAPENKFLRLPMCDEAFSSDTCIEAVLTLENDVEKMIDFAKESEESALSVKNVVSSEGASISHRVHSIYIKNSNGNCGYNRDEQYSGSVTAVARSADGDTEVDYDFSISKTFDALKAANCLGQEAGRRAASKLGGKKIKSFVGHVIFDNRVSNQLLYYLLTAINGGLVYKKHTFLHDRLNTQIFRENVNIIDDPLMQGGLRNSQFDSELVACGKMNLVEKGILQNFLLNIESAGKLFMKTNGRAQSSGSIGSYNTYVANGECCVADMIKSVESGIVITNVMGNGIDIASGNYSQGVSGFKIENGSIVHPIKEMTVAGNMLSMFSKVVFANDLEYRTGVDAPTAFIEDMTIAGI